MWVTGRARFDVMMTTGIDLAADEKKTGVATIEWGSGTATITNVVVGAGNQWLIEAITGAEAWVWAGVRMRESPRWSR